MSQIIDNRNEETDKTKWAINGVELTFDANDADDAERFENAVEKLKNDEKFPRVGKNSEIIRRYCQLFRDFFNGIFGNGTAEKIGIKDNARICNCIYEDFLLFVKNQKDSNEDFAKRMASITATNREQRRKNSKVKSKVQK